MSDMTDQAYRKCPCCGSTDGLHPPMCRALAILAAKRTVAEIPADRRAEHQRRFKQAQEQARFHADYERPG